MLLAILRNATLAFMANRMIEFYIGTGLWWVRVFGYGVHAKDILRNRLLFSEREGLVHRLQIGNWSFRFLSPLRRWA
jgi:hypothetical protein